MIIGVGNNITCKEICMRIYAFFGRAIHPKSILALDVVLGE